MGEIVVGRLQEGNRGYHYTWRNFAFRSCDAKQDPEKESLGKSGIWTGDITECMVVCAAYYSKGAWKQFWFQHVPGGLDNDIMKSIQEGLADCPETTQRYAVVAARSKWGTDEVSDHLIRIGIPAQNVKIYVPNSSRGFAFGLNFVDDVFGEVTSTGDQLPDDPAKFFIL
jgi:hypothetical protein